MGLDVRKVYNPIRIDDGENRHSGGVRRDRKSRTAYIVRISLGASTLPFQLPAARRNASTFSSVGDSRTAMVTSFPSGRSIFSRGSRRPRLTRARMVPPIDLPPFPLARTGDFTLTSV